MRLFLALSLSLITLVTGCASSGWSLASLDSQTSETGVGSGSGSGQSSIDRFKLADEAIRADRQNPVLYLDKVKAAITLARESSDVPDRLEWYGELRSTVESYERIPASIRRSHDTALDSVLLSAWTEEMESALSLVDGRWTELAEADLQGMLAMSHLDNAMMIMPERHEAYETAGALAYRTGQPERALGILLQGIAMTEGDVPDTYREKLSYIHLELGDVDEAVLALEPAFAQGTPSRQTLNAYVNALILAGRSSEAIEWLRGVLEEDPADMSARNTLSAETAMLLDSLAQSLFDDGEDELDIEGRVDRMIEYADGLAALLQDMGDSGEMDIDHAYVVGHALAKAGGQLEAVLTSIPEELRASVLELSQVLMKQALPLWDYLYASRPECNEAYTTLLVIYRSLGMTLEARELQLNHQG
jgi:tetratricopeptide (TPR) repeat protein